MATKYPRINVTFEKILISELTLLSKQVNKSVSSLVRELTIEALELREDRYLSRIAEKLDNPDSKLFDHKDAWS